MFGLGVLSLYFKILGDAYLDVVIAIVAFIFFAIHYLFGKSPWLRNRSGGCSWISLTILYKMASLSARCCPL